MMDLGRVILDLARMLVNYQFSILFRFQNLQPMIIQRVYPSQLYELA